MSQNGSEQPMSLSEFRDVFIHRTGLSGSEAEKLYAAAFGEDGAPVPLPHTVYALLYTVQHSSYEDTMRVLALK